MKQHGKPVEIAPLKPPPQPAGRWERLGNDVEDEDTEKTPMPVMNPPVLPPGSQNGSWTEEDFNAFSGRMNEFLKSQGLVVMPANAVGGLAQPSSTAAQDALTKATEEPLEVIVTDPSLILTKFWFRAKNAIWFDMAKKKAFGQPPLRDFPENGTISDFINVIIDDYFRRVYQAGLGIIRKEEAY